MLEGTMGEVRTTATRRRGPVFIGALALALAGAVGACEEASAPAGVGPSVTADDPAVWAGLHVRVVGDARPGAGPVVVLLHGLGGDGDSLLSMARALSDRSQIRVVLPEAPVARAFGGRAWWSLDLPMPPDELAASTRDLSASLDFVPPGLPPARRRVLALLDEVQERLGVSSDRIVLAGYSQGAILAMDAALHAEGPLAGAAAMSGTLLAEPAWRAHMAARRAMPVFLSHGRRDLLLPYVKAVRLRDLLRREGLQVTWVEFEGAHVRAPEVTRALRMFLQRVFGSPRAARAHAEGAQGNVSPR